MKQATSAHQSINVRCSMQEPIELLIDKLSTKSSDLYIFWQNYDQLYRQYNQKVNENNKLKEEIEYLQHNVDKLSQAADMKRDNDDGYLKQRLRAAENHNQELKNQIDKLKNSNRDLKIQTSRFIEQTSHMQTLINQLREQNSLQKNSITNILQKLKVSQGQLGNYAKIYEQLEEKQLMVTKLMEKDKQTQIILDQKDQEIEQLTTLCKDLKLKYERILKQSLDNAKQSVLNSLPTSVKVNYQKNKI